MYNQFWPVFFEIFSFSQKSLTTLDKRMIKILDHLTTYPRFQTHDDSRIHALASNIEIIISINN